MSRIARAAIERAKATGELPHEFLLRVARGELVSGEKEKPSLSTRIDAAKAAAPYFAPKLSFSETETLGPGDPRDMSDDDLDAAIKAEEQAIAAIEKSQRSSKTEARARKPGAKAK